MICSTFDLRRIISFCTHDSGNDWYGFLQACFGDARGEVPIAQANCSFDVRMIFDMRVLAVQRLILHRAIFYTLVSPSL